jgi:hypothetical protein
MTQPGCTYITGTTQAWNRKKKAYETVNLHCNKMTAEAQTMCPKHILFVEDEAKKDERAEEKRRLTREFNKQQEFALKTSPLAAINPRFDDDGNRRTGYEERFR